MYNMYIYIYVYTTLTWKEQLERVCLYLEISELKSGHPFLHHFLGFIDIICLAVSHPGKINVFLANFHAVRMKTYTDRNGLRIPKNIFYWYQKNYPQGSKKNMNGIKKIPPETYTLINHWAHHFLHNCAPIAHPDANTNASVSGLLLHICRSVCINLWMYACTHVCMYVCMVYVCMHVLSGCMRVYVQRHKHQDASRRIADSGCSSTCLNCAQLHVQLSTGCTSLKAEWQYLCSRVLL